MTIRAATGPSPTDLELMRYVDGELEGDRLAAVEAWLGAPAAPGHAGAARAKLAALGMVSRVVREGAQGAAGRADGIADAVMGRIAMGGDLPYPRPGRIDRAARPAPANDTSRLRYLALAGVCTVAAAAAFILWSRASTPAASGAPVAITAPAPAAREGEALHGVEVSAVDFGACTGAVLYVPTGTSPSSTTTVVWLSDDDAVEGDGE